MLRVSSYAKRNCGGRRFSDILMVHFNSISIRFLWDGGNRRAGGRSFQVAWRRIAWWNFSVRLIRFLLSFARDPACIVVQYVCNWRDERNEVEWLASLSPRDIPWSLQRLLPDTVPPYVIIALGFRFVLWIDLWTIHQACNSLHSTVFYSGLFFNLLNWPADWHSGL